MRDFHVLFLYPNLRGMNMLPYSIALFSRLLLDRGFKVDIFDTTYYKLDDDDFDSDKKKEQNLAVRPFDFKEKGIELKTTDAYSDFEKKIEEFQPDLIAMSVTEDMFPLGLTFLKHIAHLDIPILVGGVFSTFAPEKVLQNREIDMVCVGEGENALIDLCEAMRAGKDYYNVQNLWIKRNGDIIKNPMGQVVDVNTNPLPDFSLFEEARLYRPMAGKIYRMLPVETHRGCPYTCAFCNSPSQINLYRSNNSGSFFRKKSMAKTREEIEYYVRDWGVEYLYFWADTFFAYSNREFDAFCEMYADFKLPFWCQTRPETITEERVKKLRDVGLHRMSLGIEHGNEEFRKRVVKREYKNEVIVKALEVTGHLEVPVSVNNIVAFPTETPELAMDTVHLNRQIERHVDTMNCYFFTPFHGTPLRKMAVDYGYIEEDTFTGCLTREPVLNMPQFPKEKIKGLVRTFSMYVRWPESRWKDIAIAEKFTPEGDRMFEKLRDEFMQTFYGVSTNGV